MNHDEPLRFARTHTIVYPCEVGSHDWVPLKFSSGQFTGIGRSGSRLSILETAFRDVRFSDVTIFSRPPQDWELDPNSFYALGRQRIQLIARVGDHRPDMWGILEWDGPRNTAHESGRFTDAALEATMKEMIENWRKQEQDLAQQGMKPPPKPKLMLRHEYTLCELLPSSMIETVPLLLLPKPTPMFEPAPLSEEEEWEQAKRDKQRRAQVRAKG